LKVRCDGYKVKNPSQKEIVRPVQKAELQKDQQNLIKPLEPGLAGISNEPRFWAAGLASPDAAGQTDGDAMCIDLMLDLSRLFRVATFIS
jgi:hypothetical protein